MAEVSIDAIDRDILNEIQSNFPIEERPYEVIGKRLGVSEEDVLNRVKRLKDMGVIRRIGGNFHSYRLDFTSTLCAARVPEEKLDEFVSAVNSYAGVTHNYLRNNTYNVWFTFIAEDMEFIERSLKDISEATGVKDILNLPAVKMYKIKVHFDV